MHSATRIRGTASTPPGRYFAPYLLTNVLMFITLNALLVSFHPWEHARKRVSSPRCAPTCTHHLFLTGTSRPADGSSPVSRPCPPPARRESPGQRSRRCRARSPPR